MKDYPMTDDTIDRARAEQLADRAKVEKETGVVITDEPVEKLSRERCPRCTFTATARTEGRAIRALAGHLVGVHMQETR